MQIRVEIRVEIRVTHPDFHPDFHPDLLRPPEIRVDPPGFEIEIRVVCANPGGSEP